MNTGCVSRENGGGGGTLVLFCKPVLWSSSVEDSEARPCCSCPEAQQ